MLCNLLDVLPDYLIDLSVCLSLAHGHVVDDLVQLFRREEVPKTFCAEDHVLVIWIRGDDFDLWLRDHSNLVRDQVTEGSRNLETWVHPCSEEDTIAAILCLSHLASVVVDSVHLLNLLRSVDDVRCILVLAIFFAVTPNMDGTVSNPANIKLLWSLDNKRRSRSTEQIIKLLLTLLPDLQPIPLLPSSNGSKWIISIIDILLF
jgi:hypothetical protein